MKKLLSFFLSLILATPCFAQGFANGNGYDNGLKSSGGGSGSGTVNSGTSNQVAKYSSSGTTVSGSTVLTDNGTNVGIGSPTPGATLDVAGTVRATSYISSGSLTGQTNYLASNVGIGSPHPGQALDVNGTVMATNFQMGNNTNSNIAADQIFNVKLYGAKGDGIHWNDGTVTAGSTAFSSALATFKASDVGKVIMIYDANTTANSTTNNGGGNCTSGSANFTDAGASFAASDKGKVINIAGAATGGKVLNSSILNYTSATAITLSSNCGTTVTTANYTYGNPRDLTTTISAFVDSNDVTLAASANTSVSGVDYTYGSDDTSVIQNTINATNTSGGGTVFFPTGIYIVNGAFGTNPNSQLALPNILFTSPVLSMRIMGERPKDLSIVTPVDSGGSIVLFTKNGTSTQSGLAIYGTSVPITNHFSNVYIDIENIGFRFPSDYQGIGIDLTQAAIPQMNNLAVDHDNYPSNIGFIIPSGGASYGIKSAATLNYAGGRHNFTNVLVNNFNTGLWMGEHFVSGGIAIINSIYCAEIPKNVHAVEIENLDCEGDQYDLNFTASTGSIDAVFLETENYSNALWNGTLYTINDPNGYGVGTINYHSFNDTGAAPTGVTNGGTYLNVNNMTKNQFTWGLSNVSNTTNGFIGNTNISSGNLNVPSGNIGIGTSSAPYLLDAVTSANNFQGLNTQNINAGNFAATQVTAYNNTASAAGMFSYGSAYTTAKLANNQSFLSTNGMYVFDSGGVTSGAHNSIQFVTGGTNDTPTLSLTDGNPGNVGIGTVGPQNRFEFGTGLVEITSGGNIGIGSLTPGQKLDVQGTIRGLSGGTCTTLYTCVGGVDAGVIQTSACNLCPAGSCTPMNGCF